MPAKSLTRKGKPRLVPDRLFKEAVDNLDALLAMELSPAGIGELIVNGKKSILRIDVVAIADAAGLATPFKLIKAGTQIRVKYGIVAGQAPTGMSLGDAPPYLLTPVGTSGKVYLKLTTDGDDGFVTSRTIGIGATLPADSDGEYHLEIGSYSISGGVLSVATAIGGSQAFELCGGAGGEPTWGLV